jgi:hypothetical protein
MNHASCAAKYGVMAVLFVELLLDEVPLFALLLPLMMFPERFIRRPLRRPDLTTVAGASAAYAVPVVAFLLFVLVAAPAITQHFFAYTFRYFETLLGYGVDIEALACSTIISFKTNRILHSVRSKVIA